MSFEDNRTFLLPMLVALRNGHLNRKQVSIALESWKQRPSTNLVQVLVEQGELSNVDSDWIQRSAEQLDDQSFPEIVSEFESYGIDVRWALEFTETSGKGHRTSTHCDHDSTEKFELDADRTTAHLPQNDHTQSMGGDSSRLLNFDYQMQHRFRILRPHASGGLGRVSLAKDDDLRRTVALKEIKDQFAFDPQNRARFLREAEVTGRLEHPGIVPVYAAGTFTDGRPYYAMRFIKGDSLRDAIQQFHSTEVSEDAAHGGDYQGLEFRRLLRRLIDVCNAIAYAHSQGIIHRDIKPANVMLGEFGETLVVDWGLAKELTDQHDEPDILGHGMSETGEQQQSTAVYSDLNTEPGLAVGTPAYMSPEQASGDVASLGTATDIYALGATLYTMLTGQAPLVGKTALEVLERVRVGAITKPREVRPNVPFALEAICLKAMAHAPDKRYANASEIADELERYLADRAVTAVRESAWTRARRWFRHHPKVLAGLSASVLIGLLSALIAASIVSGKNSELVEINEDLIESNQQTLQAQQTAQQNARSARNMVNEFLVDVTDAKFLQNGTQDEQRFRLDLLEKARHYFEGLIANNPELDDVESKSSKADAHYRLAKIARDVGDFETAFGNATEAVKLFEELHSSPSRDPQSTDQLAESLATLSFVNSDLGKTRDATEVLGRAIDLRESLLTGESDSVELRHNIGRNKNALALMLVDIGEISRAEAVAKEARDILESIATTASDDVASKYTEMLALLALSHAKSEAGDFAASIELLRRGISIADPLINDSNDSNEAKDISASMHQNLASDLNYIGESSEARRELNLAIQMRRELVDAGHADFENKLYLASAYKTSSQWQWDDGNAAAALDACEIAIQMLQDLQSPNTSAKELENYYASALRLRATIRLGSGERQGGLEDYREALRLMKANAEGDHFRLEDKHDYALSLNNFANILSGAGEEEQQVAVYREAAEVIDAVTKASEDSALAHENRAKIFGNLGSTLGSLGEMKEGLDFLIESSRSYQLVAERTGLLSSAGAVAWSYNRVASLLTNMDDEAAIEWFSKAIAAYEEIQDPGFKAQVNYIHGLGGTLVNAADSHQYFENFTTSHQLLDRALELMRPMAIGPDAHPVIRQFYRNGLMVRHQAFRHELELAFDEETIEPDLARFDRIAQDNLQLVAEPDADDYRWAAEAAWRSGRNGDAIELLRSSINVADPDTQKALSERLDQWQAPADN